MKTLSVFKNELLENINWHFGWFLGLFGSLLLLVVIYPGDEAIRDFMPLLQTDLFEAFIGSIGGASPNYTLWIAILIPMMTVAYFLYGLTTGVRVAVQSISDQTGELIHTLPVSRKQFLLARFVAPIVPFIIFIVSQFIIFGTDIFGYAIEPEKLVTISWWGLFFLIGATCIGIVLGLLAGNTGRGMQYSFLFTLLLYAIQVIGRLQTDYADLNNFNPLNFYQPETVLLSNTMKEGTLFDTTFPLYPVYTVVLIFILLIFAFLEYNRKDLSDDAGFHLNIFKRLSKKNKIILKLSVMWSAFTTIFVPKKIRNNPFVFWARYLEKRFPMTADFIYSDNMTLFISFLAIVTVFPFQLGLYPGDELIKESIVGFASSPIFMLLTYGINLGETPYLWFVTTQAIGVDWIILNPLIFYWVRKAISKDSNSETGEILGSIPIQSQSVVFQRLLAIFLELIYLVLWMMFFVIFSEFLTGATYNLTWELIALVSLIPLYAFLIIALFCINLYFKNRGSLLSGLFLIFIVLSYFISMLNETFNTWYMRGIFALYNPVLIMQEKSILVANNGLIILSILALMSFLVLIKLSTKYDWIHLIENKRESKSM